MQDRYELRIFNVLLFFSRRSFPFFFPGIILSQPHKLDASRARFIVHNCEMSIMGFVRFTRSHAWDLLFALSTIHCNFTGLWALISLCLKDTWIRRMFIEAWELFTLTWHWTLRAGVRFLWMQLRYMLNADSADQLPHFLIKFFFASMDESETPIFRLLPDLGRRKRNRERERDAYGCPSCTDPQ